MRRIEVISLLMAVMLLLLLLMAGCKPQKEVQYVEVPIEVQHTQYVDRYIQRADSVWMHDSIYIDRSRDTLLVERWHTRYVSCLMRDTVRVEKTDSVQVPVRLTETRTETVEVPRPLSWWQRALQWLGGAALFAAALLGGWRLVKRKLRKYTNLF